MAILLFFAGAFAVGLGLFMAAIGVPDSEFSFGNTLIMAGSTVGIGGLIVMALSGVVFRLQQVIDLLPVQSIDRPVRSTENQKISIAPAAADGRVPLPANMKSEPSPRSALASEPVITPIKTATLSISDQAVQVTTAILPNPDRTPALADPKTRRDEKEVRTSDISLEQRRTYFDALANQKAAPDNLRDPIEADLASSQAGNKSVKGVSEEEIPPAAILKSGVVDGMAYTLYVDGSIEAELPKGTLRFASITELRGHLEKSA